MSEEKAEKSTWDELVGELGVNVTDEALERRQPPPKELPTHRRGKVEETQAVTSDWEGLASSLGIEVPAISEQLPVKKPVEQPPAKKPAASRPEKSAPVETHDEPELRVEEPKIEIDVEIQRVDSSEFIEEIDGEEESIETPTITGEAARSAFDALFAADAASWGSAFVSARSNVESSFLFTEGEEAVFAEDISDDSAEEEEEEGDPKKGRRRRRRGGRGRGRSKSGAGSENENNLDPDREEQAESAGEETADSDSESPTESTAPEKRRRRRRSRGRGRSKDDKELTSEEEDSRVKQQVASHMGDEEDDDDLEEDLLDDDDSPSTAGSRPSHRNLPTWDEAIGVIVDTNLAQRSKSPARQSSGSSRGRGHGGRRHKKS